MCWLNKLKVVIWFNKRVKCMNSFIFFIFSMYLICMYFFIYMLDEYVYRLMDFGDRDCLLFWLIYNRNLINVVGVFVWIVFNGDVI